jgi:hypothetical protein
LSTVFTPRRGKRVRRIACPERDALARELEQRGFRVFSVEDREDFYRVEGERR